MRQCQVCGDVFDAPAGRGRPPETCSPKCYRKRRNQQRREAKVRAAERGCPEHLHGTQAGATHYGCHCPKCREWWRTYQKARRAAKKADTAEKVEEGVHL